MTSKTPAQIQAEITSLFPDNTSGQISAASLRTVTNDLTTMSLNQNIVLSGSAVGVLPGSIIQTSDNAQITPSTTDPNGNYTPEGWYNVSSLTVNWTTGNLSTATGARTALLANVFFDTATSPSNTANFYSSALLTCNIYVDDNGTAGTPIGAAFGVASVSYLKSTVKHWGSISGAEFDVVVEAGAAVLHKYGVLVSNYTSDAVQGSVVDTAFAVSSQAGCPGWRTGLLLSNSGSSPLSADGTIIKTAGSATFTNVIDVTSATVTGYLLKSSALNITGQGAYAITTGVLSGDVPFIGGLSGSTSQHTYIAIGRVSYEMQIGIAGSNDQFMPGTVTGDAAYTFANNFFLGVNGSAPYFKIAKTTGNAGFSAAVLSTGPTAGVGYGTGAGGTVAQASSKATTVVLNTICGQITMNNAALAAATIVSFTLTDSAIAATDVLVLNHISGGTPGSYGLNGRAAAGSATIDVRNNTAGSLSEAIVLQFVVIKGVNA
jgi:hypothetical protein